MQIVFCIIFRVWHCLSCTPTGKLSKLFYWHINKDQRANQRRKNNGETHTKRMWHDDGRQNKVKLVLKLLLQAQRRSNVVYCMVPRELFKNLDDKVNCCHVLISQCAKRKEHTHTHIDGIFNECKTFKWNCTNLFKTINIFTATTIYREMDLICSLVRIPFGLWRRWWWRSSKGEMEWLHSEVKLKT